MVRTLIGPPKKLSHALDLGRALWCFCLACGHATRFEPRPLIHKIGDDLTFEELGKRMRCTRCKTRGHGHVVVSPFHSSRMAR